MSIAGMIPNYEVAEYISETARHTRARLEGLARISTEELQAAYRWNKEESEYVGNSYDRQRECRDHMYIIGLALRKRGIEVDSL